MKQMMDIQIQLQQYHIIFEHHRILFIQQIVSEMIGRLLIQNRRALLQSSSILRWGFSNNVYRKDLDQLKTYPFYVHSEYSTLLNQSKFMYVYFAPALLMFGVNFAISWQVWNTVGFMLLLGAGYYLRNNRMHYSSMFVKCLQINPAMIGNVYLTTKRYGPPFHFVKSLNLQLPENEHQQQLWEGYHPLKQIYPHSNLKLDLNQQQYKKNNKAEDYDKYQTLKQAQKKYMYWKFPCQLIQLELLFPTKELAEQIVRDKEQKKLTMFQMIEKYKKCPIMVKFMQERKQIFQLILNPTVAINQDDYRVLVAKALGYQVGQKFDTKNDSAPYVIISSTGQISGQKKFALKNQGQTVKKVQK